MATPWYTDLVDRIMLGPGNIPLHMAVELDEARLLEGWRESGPAIQMLMLVALGRDAALAVRVAHLLADLPGLEPVTAEFLGRVAQEVQLEVMTPLSINLPDLTEDLTRQSRRSDGCDRMAISAMWNVVHVLIWNRATSPSGGDLSLDRQRALLTLTRTAARVLEHCGSPVSSQKDQGEALAPRSMLEIVAAAESWPQ